MPLSSAVRAGLGNLPPAASRLPPASTELCSKLQPPPVQCLSVVPTSKVAVDGVQEVVGCRQEGATARRI